MIVGIVGLGLIGGSFAKAYQSEGHTVFAKNRNPEVLKYAQLCGAVNKELTADNISECDLIIVSVYPAAAIKFLEEYGQYIGKKPIVVDACGTKREMTREGMRLAEKYGFTFFGGHPMAGTHFSGFDYSGKDMYKGAPMVLVPPAGCSPELLEKVKKLLSPAGFGSYSVTTAEIHDQVIAFTSQLAHVVSSAYIKSPTALVHSGFSAGSYRDMTRVAWLNPQMWSELFLDNKDNLINEIDIMIKNLQDYKDVLISGDRAELERLLEEGKRRKEEVDG